MQYNVVSGDYSVVIDRVSPKQAAIDAIGLLKHKQHRPPLAKLTTVTEGGVLGGKVVYLSTTILLQENGMGSYEPAEAQDSGNKKAH